MAQSNFHKAVASSITQEKQKGIFRKTFEDLKSEVKALARKLIEEGKNPTSNEILKRKVHQKQSKTIELELGEIQAETVEEFLHEEAQSFKTDLTSVCQFTIEDVENRHSESYKIYQDMQKAVKAQGTEVNRLDRESKLRRGDLKIIKDMPIDCLIDIAKNPKTVTSISELRSMLSRRSDLSEMIHPDIPRILQRFHEKEEAERVRNLEAQKRKQQMQEDEKLLKKKEIIRGLRQSDQSIAI